MDSRQYESSLPLGLGVIVAVAVNVLMLVGLDRGIGAAGPTDAVARTDRQQMLPEMRELALGQDASVVSTVSWVAYDDFRQLLARQSTTRQPAVQRDVDPVPNAEPVLDPTPAAPPSPVVAPGAAAEQVQVTPPPELTRLPSATSLPPMRASPDGRVPQAVLRAPDRQAPDEPVTQEMPEQTQVTAGGAPARPTSAPRDEREADPTDFAHSWRVMPGGVLVGQGLEIQTARPVMSIVGQLTSIPRNAIISVSFDRQGDAVDAQMVRSTGYKDWDAAIIASLYKWKAKGEALEKAQPHLTITLPFKFLE